MLVHSPTSNSLCWTYLLDNRIDNSNSQLTNNNSPISCCLSYHTSQRHLLDITTDFKLITHWKWLIYLNAMFGKHHHVYEFRKTSLRHRIAVLNPKISWIFLLLVVILLQPSTKKMKKTILSTAYYMKNNVIDGVLQEKQCDWRHTTRETIWLMAY